MIVAISIGTLIKLILALAVAIIVVVALMTNLATQDIPAPNKVPPPADIRADR